MFTAQFEIGVKLSDFQGVIDEESHNWQRTNVSKTFHQVFYFDTNK